MSQYPNVRTRDELPDEYANGDRIEYVWIVYRPPFTSTTGDVEMLGAFESAEAAKDHACIAERKGAVQIEELRVSDGEGLKID